MKILSIISGIVTGAATTAVMKGVMHTSTPVAIAGGCVTGTIVGVTVNGICKSALVDEFNGQTEDVAFSATDSATFQKLSDISEEISEDYENERKAELEAREAEFREKRDKIHEETDKEIQEIRAVQREKFRKELDAKVDAGGISPEDREAILARSDELWEQEMAAIDKRCKCMFPEIYK